VANEDVVAVMTWLPAQKEVDARLRYRFQDAPSAVFCRWLPRKSSKHALSLPPHPEQNPGAMGRFRAG